MKYILTLSVLLSQVLVFAQSVQRCATVDVVKIREAQYPGYQAAVDELYRKAVTMSKLDPRASGEVYQIPVVVHIIYNNSEENISDDLVYSQIARLNTDYRRLNADTSDTRPEFLPVAADASIEFYLAGEDPDGNPTSGITRTETNRTDFSVDIFNPNSMDEMKMESTGGVAAWDTERYLNLWVCDLWGDSPVLPVLGFSFPPSIAPNWPSGAEASSSEFEGVTIHYKVFGDGNPLSTGELAIADKGRTAVHEVGHFLGLRHIWGDPNFLLGEDGCDVDDGLSDTPNAQASAQQTCNHSSNTCVDSPIDHPDMIENYMDYAEEQCMNMFTQEQVDIMTWMLDSARSGLFTDPVGPSSIVEGFMAADFSVFPNPADQQLTLQLSRSANFSNAELINLQGKTVALLPEVNGFTRAFNIELPSIVPGVYILSVIVDGHRLQKRLIIQ